MADQCTKCGSTRVIPRLAILDQGEWSDGQLKIYVGDAHPEAWIFKSPVFAKLRATICGECGYTEMYVDNPNILYEAYLKAQSSTESAA